MPEAAPTKRCDDNRLKIKTTLENMKPGGSFRYRITASRRRNRVGRS
jgi:hypothetical protein